MPVVSGCLKLHRNALLEQRGIMRLSVLEVSGQGA